VPSAEGPKFADSPLEGTRFELPVPREMPTIFEPSCFWFLKIIRVLSKRPMVGNCAPSRFQRQWQGCVGQRQHAVEFGQRAHGFGGHRVGDRVAVGAEHAAFERRAILARSPHQPYAVKMDRERELKIIRRAYAKQVTAAVGVGDPQVEAALPARRGPRMHGSTA